MVSSAKVENRRLLLNFWGLSHLLEFACCAEGFLEARVDAIS
jgi:hypothetical protein